MIPTAPPAAKSERQRFPRRFKHCRMEADTNPC